MLTLPHSNSCDMLGTVDISTIFPLYHYRKWTGIINKSTITNPKDFSVVLLSHDYIHRSKLLHSSFLCSWFTKTGWGPEKSRIKQLCNFWPVAKSRSKVCKSNLIKLNLTVRWKLEKESNDRTSTYYQSSVNVMILLQFF